MEGVTRLAEVLVALSLTTDLGSGVPFEKGLRTSVVASRLGQTLDLSLADRRAIYYASLLRSLGCTAHASVFADVGRPRPTAAARRGAGRRASGRPAHGRPFFDRWRRRVAIEFVVPPGDEMHMSKMIDLTMLGMLTRARAHHAGVQ